mgnify:CR=1 FL=1
MLPLTVLSVSGKPRPIINISVAGGPTVPVLFDTGSTGLRIFAGYAGWSGGQLEGEIRRGDWFVVDSEPRDPFTAAPESLWEQVLRRQGGMLQLVASYPDDPSMN